MFDSEREKQSVRIIWGEKLKKSIVYDTTRYDSQQIIWGVQPLRDTHTHARRIMLRRKVGSAAHASSSTPSSHHKKRKKTKKKQDAEEAETKKGSEKIRIFSYFGRQVNLDFHGKDANVYSLLRSWVQNDPECDVSNTQDVVRSLLPPPLDDAKQLKTRPPVGHEPMPEVNYLNSLQSVNSKSLLESHLVYMKAVRKWMSTRRQRRRSRYTKRLQALSPGFEMIPLLTPVKKNAALTDMDNTNVDEGGLATSSSSPKRKRRRLSVDTTTE